MRYPGENAAGRAPGRRQGPSGRVTPPEARPAASGVKASGVRASGASGASGKASRAALFAPGYSGGRVTGRGHAPAAGGGQYGPAGGTAGKGPARGFAPAPGEPPPLYPPGPFAAWNRASAQDGNGYDPSASGPISDVWPASAETGYSAGWHTDAGYADAGYPDAGYPDAGYPDAGYPDAGYPDRGQPEPGYAGLDSTEPGYPAPAAVDNPAPGVTSTATWGAAGDTSGVRVVPARGAQVTPAAGGSDTDRAASDPNQPASTGPFDRATPAPFNRLTAAPSQSTATRPGTRGHGSRGRKRPRRRGKRARVLLACGLALVVVAGAAYFWVARGHKPSAPSADSQRTTGARPSPPVPSPGPSPSLGSWGHIESRALDPVPLTLAELFPASFSDGGVSYVKTVQKAKVHCAGALAGSQLIAAVARAGCTQAMRASYLSSSRTLMGTIGVLNLVTATAAQQAGKAAGPSEFIAQLPAASGPAKNLTKGTGFEAAEVKGHYLVLVWAEFADLRAPRSPAQRTELEDFISLLMQKTANVSLAMRQVTGSPPP
jgi:hypothetical protein